MFELIEHNVGTNLDVHYSIEFFSQWILKWTNLLLPFVMRKITLLKCVYRRDKEHFKPWRPIILLFSMNGGCSYTRKTVGWKCTLLHLFVVLISCMSDCWLAMNSDLYQKSSRASLDSLEEVMLLVLFSIIALSPPLMWFPYITQEVPLNYVSE